MESIILGLLMVRARTLYEIKKVLESPIALFYSASFGSISAALAAVASRGLVEGVEHVERGRNKKVYTITDAGCVAFHDWLNTPIPAEKVRDPVLLRLYFLGYLTPIERVALVEQHLATIETTRAALRDLEAHNVAQVIPADRQDLARFQMLTLDYGRDYYSFSIAWFTQLLATLKAEASA